MQALVGLNDFLEKFCRKTAGFTLILFTLFVTVNIVLRTAFSYALSWAQDGAVMLFIWNIFIGAPVALRTRKHFVIDLIGTKNERLGTAIDITGDVVVYAFLYIMVVYGVSFLSIAHEMYYSYLYVPQSTVVVAIPISGLVMVLMNTENLILNLRKFHGGKSPDIGGA